MVTDPSRAPGMVEDTLWAILTRNFVTDDPAPVIKDLRAAAGPNTGLLAEVCGVAAGFFSSEKTAVLRDAILNEIDGARKWVEIGRQRLREATAGSARPHTHAVNGE